MIDKRVWMYRKGEARLFASPEDVPAGEGWSDAPSVAEAEPTEPTRQIGEKVDDATPRRRRGRPA